MRSRECVHVLINEVDGTLGSALSKFVPWDDGVLFGGGEGREESTSKEKAQNL